MNWLLSFFSSSVGKKTLMSLTGLFLISFLVIHLVGNLQLLKDDGGLAFNQYAHFMTTNPIIKFTSYGLYFSILLHAIVGMWIAWYNRKAKGSKYAVANHNRTTWASKNMALLGSLVFAFILIHMGDFWLKMKMDELPYVTYDAEVGPIKDLYFRVAEAFKEPLLMIAYVIGVVVLGFHLWHGFQSAFQTLGLNHKKYTPLIKTVGKAFSILITIGFAVIPLYHFFIR